MDRGRSKFWYIDMPDEWQQARGKIVELLEDMHCESPTARRTVTADRFPSVSSPSHECGPVVPQRPETPVPLQGLTTSVAPPPAADAAARRASNPRCGPSLILPPAQEICSGTCPGPLSYATELRNSADILRGELLRRNIPHAPMGFYGPLRNFHASIRSPAEEGRRVDLVVEQFISGQHGLIGHPSLHCDDTFHARRFLVTIAAGNDERRAGYIEKRPTSRSLHITLGYYGTKKLLEP
ncbi:MAG: hypothetical protein BJ554DRAFT_2402, partial [Olpidium bornovanus]